MDDTKRTSIGLDENLAGALAYVLGWITGVALLLAEHENQYVRFHAFQSTIVFGALSVLWFVSVAIPFVGWVFSFFIIPVVSIFVWWLAMFKAYHGQRFKLPIAGDIAEQRAQNA
jgi:uncharacterized membrane protein